jgi:ATP-dependent Lhr-like helicase
VVTIESPTLFAPDLPAEGFHPAVAAWFARRFPDGPTDAQRQGWARIAAGDDTLVAAPTGSGKTLAGFLVGIDRLYRAHAAGIDVAGRAQVAYVSPLKALAVDIAENLDRPLREIAEVADELGYDAPDLRVGVRTGDTTASERSAMVRRPPNFVVTTPESLYLLVTAKRTRAMLATVETVIVDEIHAVARDKRGSHLALTLERLEQAAAARPQRIGLSATQRPIDLVADLLVGAGAPRPCAVVDTGHRRRLDLALELPQGELEAVATAEQMGDVVERIAALVAGHRTTLVFVNTRRLAERLAHQLGERLGDDVVAAHHGSLSKDRRQRVETRLRAGELRALVATASLELGIDIGPVELVCQVASPRSIATFLQRVGRANHSLRGVPKGHLFPLTRDELVECAALLVAVGAGELDAVVPPEAPLDILTQQIVAEVAAAPEEGYRLDDLYALVRRSHPYRDLPRDDFDEVVAMVAQGITTGRGRRAAYLHLDGVNGEVRARPAARLPALTSGGAIPEIGDYRVVLEPDDLFLGTVNEDWAVESMAGDIFLLGTHSWQIRQVTSGVVRVADADGKPPTIPFWTGEAPARTPELSQQVSGLRATIEQYLVAGDPDGARAWLHRAAPLEDAAVAQIVDYVAAGRAVLGVVPTHDDLVFERFFDEADGMHLVVHSPYGGRVNRALGLALRKRFCRSFNFELQAAANDDAVVLSLGPHHSFPLADVPRFLNSRTVREVLTQAVLDAPMFQSRWRWNLNRALVVLRFKGGRRNPPPIQRMESDDLMAVLFPDAAACQENVTFPIPIPDHPLVRQTVHDTLTEGLDIDGLTTLLDGIESGRVRVHVRDTTEASAFSHEILSAKPYAFLDDAEAVDRRTRAVPLRRGLPVDLSTIGRLDPAAIARVVEEVTPAPGTADELHDLLTGLVATPARDEWRPLYDELAARGRVQGAGNRWWATEQAARAVVVVRGAPDDDHPRERVAADVLRGHLEISGPLTAPALAELTGLDPPLVAAGLAVLENDGLAIQGAFTDPDVPASPDTTEWCARRLLARMHAYSRTTRRKSVEPVTAQDFMRFLLRWQHAAPGTQLRGHQGVRAVVEQLQGYEAGVATWEPHLLAKRVDGYRPGMLDRLCHDGEVTWLRLSPGATPGDPAAEAAAAPANGRSRRPRSDVAADAAGGPPDGRSHLPGADAAAASADGRSGRSRSDVAADATGGPPDGRSRLPGPDAAGASANGRSRRSRSDVAADAAGGPPDGRSRLPGADVAGASADGRSGRPGPDVAAGVAATTTGADTAVPLAGESPGRPADRRLGPSKATPVTLAFRADVGWLLQAARPGSPPEPPSVGATAEVVEALGAKGARFLSELVADTGRLATDVEAALWDGVARGLLTADGFAAIRALVEGPRRPARPARSVSRRRRGGAHGPVLAAGRWSLVEAVEPVDDREGLAEVVADQLLQRWGVVFRDLAVHEGLPLPWRDLQWALRRFEDRGLVRGGRFVAGFSGEQYALPAAVEGLAAVRRRPRDGERVIVNACDPLNLTGVIIRGARVPAVRTNTLTFVDGLPEEAPAG